MNENIQSLEESVTEDTGFSQEKGITPEAVELVGRDHFVLYAIEKFGEDEVKNRKLDEIDKTKFSKILENNGFSEDVTDFKETHEIIAELRRRYNKYGEL